MTEKKKPREWKQKELEALIQCLRNRNSDGKSAFEDQDKFCEAVLELLSVTNKKTGKVRKKRIPFPEIIRKARAVQVKARKLDGVDGSEFQIPRPKKKPKPKPKPITLEDLIRNAAGQRTESQSAIIRRYSAEYAPSKKFNQ